MKRTSKVLAILLALAMLLSVTAYALGGMAICNGYAVFGNDYNHLYIVK